MAEIDDMSKIVDPQNTIKDPDQCQQIRQNLMNKWQLRYPMQKIDELITYRLKLKTNGNPLFILEYFVNMLQNGFVILSSDGYVRPDERFMNCITIDDWSIVPVPTSCFQLN